jgi:hypothetical protein
MDITVTSAPTVAAGEQDITITPLDVTVEITYVWITPDSHTWGTLESGSSSSILMVVITNLGATITDKPSWLTIKRSSGVAIGVGDTIANEEELDVYPASANTGALRSGNVTITDARGNNDSLVVTQAANTVVTVSVVAAEASSSYFSISSASGTGTDGSASIAISFTPYHTGVEYQADFDCTYTVTKNGVANGSGTFSTINQRNNNKTIVMDSAAAGGDGINVTISSMEVPD